MQTAKTPRQSTKASMVSRTLRIRQMGSTFCSWNRQEIGRWERSQYCRWTPGKYSVLQKRTSEDEKSSVPCVNGVSGLIRASPANSQLWDASIHLSLLRRKD